MYIANTNIYNIIHLTVASFFSEINSLHICALRMYLPDTAFLINKSLHSQVYEMRDLLYFTT